MLRNTVKLCQGPNKIGQKYIFGFPYPTYPFEHENQAEVKTVADRFKKALKNHESRSPGILPAIRGPAVQMTRHSELKGGELIGEDEFGNRYYENREYTFGRSKWVVFADRTFKLGFGDAYSQEK